jgi:hypothetical protein
MEAIAENITESPPEQITLTPKQEGLVLLQEAGLSIPESARVLGIAKDYAYHINKKLSLSNKKMVVLAQRTVKNVMSGTPWGSVDKIKDSTALAAAQMVYDRVQPAIRQNVNLNINADISPVDLGKYASRQGVSNTDNVSREDKL